MTQNGGMGRGPRATPGIQRVPAADGTVEVVATEIAGITLDGPNDLAFGADGRLFFTDPRGDSDQSRELQPGPLVRPRCRRPATAS